MAGKGRGRRRPCARPRHAGCRGCSGGAPGSKTFYNSSGRAIRRATTQGDTTTFYDSSGRSSGRATTSGNTTTIYDNTGRSVGRTTRSK